MNSANLLQIFNLMEKALFIIGIILPSKLPFAIIIYPYKDFQLQTQMKKEFWTNFKNKALFLQTCNEFSSMQ